MSHTIWSSAYGILKGKDMLKALQVKRQTHVGKILKDFLRILKKFPDFISFYFVYFYVSDLQALVSGLLIRWKFFWQIENWKTKSETAECILKVKLFRFCFSDSILNLNREIRVGFKWRGVRFPDGHFP